MLPDNYGDAQSEYFAIREQCALFDGSVRFARYVPSGSGAGRFFDRLLTRPVSGMPSMRATYTVYCNDDGTLKDDGILYKLAEDDYLMMPSDIDHAPYYREVADRFGIGDLRFEECSASLAGLAIQGPSSARALIAMGFEGHRADGGFRSPALFARRQRVPRIPHTGFTADLGYECWVAPEQADELAGLIRRARSRLDLAIPGYGLAAVQACRLEGGFIVAGWDCATELDPQPGLERSPYELGMGWQVKLDEQGLRRSRGTAGRKRSNGCEHLFSYIQAKRRQRRPRTARY